MSSIATQPVFAKEYLSLVHAPSVSTLIATAASHFFPEADFRESFHAIGEFVRTHGVKKLVFDKRKLEVFHFPSMEWYYTEWKPTMVAHGLQLHAKLLPERPAFRVHVRLSREKIYRSVPEGLLDDIVVEYFENLEDALAWRANELSTAGGSGAPGQ